MIRSTPATEEMPEFSNIEFNKLRQIRLNWVDICDCISLWQQPIVTRNGLNGRNGKEWFEGLIRLIRNEKTESLIRWALNDVWLQQSEKFMKFIFQWAYYVLHAAGQEEYDILHTTLHLAALPGSRDHTSISVNINPDDLGEALRYLKTLNLTPKQRHNFFIEVLEYLRHPDLAKNISLTSVYEILEELRNLWHPISLDDFWKSEDGKMNWSFEICKYRSKKGFHVDEVKLDGKMMKRDVIPMVKKWLLTGETREIFEELLEYYIIHPFTLVFEYVNTAEECDAIYRAMVDIYFSLQGEAVHIGVDPHLRIAFQWRDLDVPSLKKRLV